MSEWSHLPNAAHIDWVIQTLGSHPEVWDSVSGSVNIAAHNAAYIVISRADRFTAYDAACRDALWRVYKSTDCGATYDTVRGSLIALLAYDDSAKYLGMTPDQLKMWAILSEEPAAILLLLPAVIAFERISELELV